MTAAYVLGDGTVGPSASGLADVESHPKLFSQLHPNLKYQLTWERPLGKPCCLFPTRCQI